MKALRPTNGWLHSFQLPSVVAVTLESVASIRQDYGAPSYAAGIVWGKFFPPLHENFLLRAYLLYPNGRCVMHTAIRIVLVGSVLCQASIVVAQKVVINATAEVASIYDPEGFLPADLEVGTTGTLAVAYKIDAVSGGPINANQASYFFPAGQLGITYRIGGHVWACSNILIGEVDVVNDEPRKINDTFGASVQDPGGLFPFQVPDGHGQLTAFFRDEVLPLDLLHGLVLPTNASDVKFTETTLAAGSITTASGGAHYWSIGLNLHDPMFASTVAVTGKSWGSVKALYAR